MEYAPKERVLIEKIINEVYPGYSFRLIARHTGHQRENQSWVYIVELYPEHAERPETIIAVKYDQPHKLLNEWKNYQEFIQANNISYSFFIRPHRLWPTEEAPELLISQYAGNLGARYASVQSFGDFCRDNLSEHPDRVKAVLKEALAHLGELYAATERTLQREVERYGQVYFTFNTLSLFIQPQNLDSPQRVEVRETSGESDDTEKSRERAAQIRAALEELIDEGTSLSEEHIRVDGKELFNPLVFFRDVLTMTPRYLKCAITHGDLNVNNLLVIGLTGAGDKESVYNPCLIDYERMAERDENGEVKEFLALGGCHHIAWDFSHFETEFLNHLVAKELQPERDALFVSALHVITQNGFKDSEMDKAKNLFSDNPFVSHAFQLVCFLRETAFQVLREKYNLFGYDGQDYMVSLFLDAFNSLRFNLEPRQKKLALMNCATALAAIEKTDLPVRLVPDSIEGVDLGWIINAAYGFTAYACVLMGECDNEENARKAELLVKEPLAFLGIFPQIPSPLGSEQSPNIVNAVCMYIEKEIQRCIDTKAAKIFSFAALTFIFVSAHGEPLALPEEADEARGTLIKMAKEIGLNSEEAMNHILSIENARTEEQRSEATESFRDWMYEAVNTIS